MVDPSCGEAMEYSKFFEDFESSLKALTVSKLTLEINLPPPRAR